MSKDNEKEKQEIFTDFVESNEFDLPMNYSVRTLFNLRWGFVPLPNLKC
jgi:hypothetical protein